MDVSVVRQLQWQGWQEERGYIKKTRPGVEDIYSWVKSQNFKFGAPQGCLVGYYKAFGEEISTLA